MILAYRVISNILYPFLIFFIYLRLFLNKEHPVRFKEKLFVSHFNINKKPEKKLIWFHAASVGEYKSIAPIIEKINSNNKNYEFLITTTTLSSGNLAEQELKEFDNIQHRFFPLDIAFLINKFLLLWKPHKIFLVDSEIWPNLIINAKKHNIQIAIINARISNKTFDRWFLFPSVAHKIFGLFDLCLCSNKKTKNNLEKLKAKNINYEGNIKLINQIKIEEIENENSDLLLKSRFWVAASIHREEDLFCLKTHLELKKNYNDIKTILAPRHLDRVKKIKSLFESFGIKTQILNSNERILNDTEVIIINSFGVLQNYYKFSKSVFIGKSIIKRLQEDSGQNPIDAAKLNCKIYHGPYVSNFDEIYEILDLNAISKEVNNFVELSENLKVDLKEFKKEEKSGFNSIKILEQDILANTMGHINNFLDD